MFMQTNQCWHFGRKLLDISLSLSVFLPFCCVCVSVCPQVHARVHVSLLADPWTVAHQAPLFMEFSRQEYWSFCHFLLQGIFPSQGLNSPLFRLLHWQAGSLPLCHLGSPFLLYMNEYSTYIKYVYLFSFKWYISYLLPQTVAFAYLSATSYHASNFWCTTSFLTVCIPQITSPLFMNALVVPKLVSIINSAIMQNPSAHHLCRKYSYKCNLSYGDKIL